MNEVGNIEGDITIALDQHFFALRRDRVGRISLAFQLKNDRSFSILKHQIERVILGVAAPRVGIELAVDEFDAPSIGHRRAPILIRREPPPPAFLPRPAYDARCRARSVQR